MPTFKNIYLLFLALAVMACGTQEKPEIGLQLYSLRNEFKEDVPGTLALIKEMGIRQLEGGGTYGLSMDAYLDLLKENNLEVVSVGAGFDLLESNPAAVVENAKAFGAKYAMCAWIPHPGDTFTIEEVKKAVEVFNAAGKVLAENGISFCYHPHGYEFRAFGEGDLFDYMVEQTDPRYVNFELDVFWAKQGGKDPVALMKKYPERMLMLHLKDRAHGTPDSDDGRAPDETNVVLGQGDVNIAGVMEVAKEIGVKYYFIEDESPDAVEQIPQSLKYLEEL